MTADTLIREDPVDSGFDWSVRSFAGALVELTGSSSSAVFSVVAPLIHEAQRAGEPCAWISTQNETFFLPDFIRCGVDTGRLTVVRVPNTRAVSHSAEYLARSAGFGFLVVDFTAGDVRDIESHFADRIVRLARRHDIAVLCLTRSSAHVQRQRSGTLARRSRDERGHDGLHDTLGSLVSIRAEASRERADDGTFRSVVRIVKDRHRGPGRSYSVMRYGPDGVH
ncbi:MAG: hypothetical protein EA426_11770 [Spirochaetaceae bacterium]|nr:MAG: hypothetical protein EA426_11770 [Spirochaetaceae bacterium]